MKIAIAPGVRLFVDIEGPGLVPDGATMRQRPTLILLHGGPGYDHSSFKPAFSRLADIAQVIYYDHRGHGRSDRRPKDECTLDTFADDSSNAWAGKRLKTLLSASGRSRMRQPGKPIRVFAGRCIRQPNP